MKKATPSLKVHLVSTDLNIAKRVKYIGVITVNKRFFMIILIILITKCLKK